MCPAAISVLKHLTVVLFISQSSMKRSKSFDCGTGLAERSGGNSNMYSGSNAPSALSIGEDGEPENELMKAFNKVRSTKADRKNLSLITEEDEKAEGSSRYVSHEIQGSSRYVSHEIGMSSSYVSHEIGGSSRYVSHEIGLL